MARAVSPSTCVACSAFLLDMGVLGSAPSSAPGAQQG